MTFIQKFGVYLTMLVFAALVATVYGMIHNQISYSFSEEYFTQFKFKQFHIPWAYDMPRIGAAYVGALSTWWMGIILFLVLGLFGFMFRTPKQMAIKLSKSFMVVITVALATGISGLIYGYIEITDQTIGGFMNWVRPGVGDPIQFIRVGYMHNASYLGGLIGLISAIIYLIFARLRNNPGK